MANSATTETLFTSIPDALEQAICNLLRIACDRELRLATAESCTGGLLASLLTDVPGLSHAFERGYVVYSNKSKQDMLGLSQEFLDRYGAVSRETAVALAEGALERGEADLCVAITGYAGSAGGMGEPGLVHFSCASRLGATQHRVERFGDIGRGGVRLAAVEAAVDMLTDAMKAR